MPSAIWKKAKDSSTHRLSGAILRHRRSRTAHDRQAGRSLTPYLPPEHRPSWQAQSDLGQALLIELLPLPFGIVVRWLTPVIIQPLPVAVAVVAVVIPPSFGQYRNELVRRVAELTAIDDIGREIVQAQLDVDELCKLMYSHASRNSRTRGSFTWACLTATPTRSSCGCETVSSNRNKPSS